jgi:hypothetical protein
MTSHTINKKRDVYVNANQKIYHNLYTVVTATVTKHPGKSMESIS